MNYKAVESIASRAEIFDDTRSNYIELVHGRVLLSLFSLFTEGETAVALRRLVFHGFSTGRSSSRNLADFEIVKNAVRQRYQDGCFPNEVAMEKVLQAIQTLVLQAANSPPEDELSSG